jgi:serine/threonine protein kinase
MLARYDLEHELGTGARGTVYCGRDKTTGGRVAIKLVTDDTPPDECGEAGALAARSHAELARSVTRLRAALRHESAAASSAA